MFVSVHGNAELLEVLRRGEANGVARVEVFAAIAFVEVRTFQGQRFQDADEVVPGVPVSQRVFIEHHDLDLVQFLSDAIYQRERLFRRDLDAGIRSVALMDVEVHHLAALGTARKGLHVEVGRLKVNETQLLVRYSLVLSLYGGDLCAHGGGL